jgi:hypothetical protein
MKEELELEMPFQTKSGLNDKQEAYKNAAGLMVSIAKHHHE